MSAQCEIMRSATIPESPGVVANGNKGGWLEGSLEDPRELLTLCDERLELKVEGGTSGLVCNGS